MECPSCSPELGRLRAQVLALTVTVRDQARALAELTDDCPPWAPSVACVYWLWAPTMWGKKSWRTIWPRVTPTVSALGSLPSPKLNPLAWERHRAERRLLGLADSTLNLELTWAKAMLSWAEENELIRRNPLRPAKLADVVSQRETRLTPADVDSLLAACDDVVDKRRDHGDDDGTRSRIVRAFVLCCFDSLLRFNEARNLRHDRIRGDGTVELLASETKGKRRRIVQLTPRTLEAIGKLKGSTLPSGYVFSTDKGLISESTLRHWFNRARDISGVNRLATVRDKRVRAHDLRAAGATTLDEAGVRATALQSVMGHVSFNTTRAYLRTPGSESAVHCCDKMQEATRSGPKRAPRRK